MKTLPLSFVPARWRRPLLWLVALWVAYSVIGFFVLPPLIKWQLLKRLPELTHRAATLRQVKVNPWALSLTVRGLELKEADGRTFASWEELYVNFQASSLFRWAWTFDQIRLVQPFAEVLLFEDGRVNLANLWAAPTNPPPPSAGPGRIPRIHIFHIGVTNGFVAFEDRTRRSPFRTEYRPINLELRGFTTRPDSDTPYSFEAESDAGRSMAWAGDVTVQPLRSAGRLEIAGVQLPRYQPYLEDFTRAVLTNGLAEVQLDYRFAADSNGLDLVLTNVALEVASAQLRDPDTGETVARLGGFELSGGSFDYRANAVRIESATLSEAAILARLKPDGRLNLLDLLVRPSAPATPPAVSSEESAKAPPVLTVAHFTLERATVSFEDQTLGTPFKTELQPIRATIKDFSTEPDKDAKFSLSATSEAAETLAGEGTFSIQPLRSAGELGVNALDLKKYLPYVEPFFRGKVIAGQLAARVPYQLAVESAGLRAGVSNLTLTLTDLDVQMPESGERVTHIQRIAFADVDADLEDRRGRVGSFSGEGGSVLVRRNRDGSLNLLGLFAVARTNAADVERTIAPATPTALDSNAPAVALGGWALQVDQLALTNYTVTLEDLMPSEPAKVILNDVFLTARHLSTTVSNAVEVTTAFRVNDSGQVNAEGRLIPMPLSAEATFAVTNLDVRVVQPYLEPFVAVEIEGGSLGSRGRVAVSLDNAASPRGEYAGDLELNQFAIVATDTERKLASWYALGITGIEAGFPPLRVKVGEIRWVRPEAHVWVDTEGRLNLTTLLKVPPADAEGAGSGVAAGGASVPELRLSRLTLEDATFAFLDESVQPPVALALNKLSGSIQGLSSTLAEPAGVALEGRVDGEAPFSVSGRINPFPAARLVDLTITNTNTQLTPLTGYLEKWGGYPLRKGRLSAGLRYRVEGNALEAENHVVVDQLTLGPRNDSPHATKLPLKLGIALLKDSDGRIDLDLPLSGRLDEPDFRLAPLVLKVLVNTIVKAAASPFKLLGALAGGSEEDDLSFIAFEPGTTNLVEGEFDKLGRLAAALAKRPALQLVIEGAIDPRRDRDALAHQKLEDQLRSRRLQELGRKSRRAVAEVPPVLEPEDRERLLRAAFVEQFGTNVAEVITANAARLAAASSAATNDVHSAVTKHRGLLRRLTGIFGSDGPVRTKAEKRLPKEDREAMALATPDLMAMLLAEKIEVPPEDFRPLIAARARLVHDWLIAEGQVTGERLLLVAPKPVDDRYAGRAQVDLSLE
ncbi:MAG: DUF748 domain-containing protein [Verrucomicrobia bacterium]|nr:DUF748 domain-containing protein [Verrucomicrobiota bacterium]